MSIKICAIGCGVFASAVHGPSYKKYAQIHPDTELCACCDLDEKKAGIFMKTFGFKRYYKDFKEMLDIEKPDAVCLVVTPELTSSLSVEILEKGYPLIMEKPPGLNRKETEKVIKAAQAKGIPNQVAFNRRYITLVKKIKSILSEEQRNNSIFDIQCNFVRAGRRDKDFATTAIHGIDTVKFLSGSDFRYVEFNYQKVSQAGDNIVNIYLNCVFKSGTTAKINFFPFGGLVSEQVVINTYNNSFFLDIPVFGSVSSGRLVHYNGEKIILDIQGKKAPGNADMFELCGFYSENTSFFDNIRAGIKPGGDVLSALQSVEIADCIRNRTEKYKAD